jgi:hypothetical protein
VAGSRQRRSVLHAMEQTAAVAAAPACRAAIRLPASMPALPAASRRLKALLWWLTAPGVAAVGEARGELGAGEERPCSSCSSRSGCCASWPVPWPAPGACLRGELGVIGVLGCAWYPCCAGEWGRMRCCCCCCCCCCWRW